MRNKRLIIIFSILLSITALVLLTSIIFSVKTVSAYCINYNDYEIQDDGTSLNQKVKSSVDLKGKSVFLIKEKDVIATVEKKVPGIKVIGAVRHFPNRVEIQYVRMYNYFEVKVGDNYYLCQCDGKVSKILKAPSNDPLNPPIQIRADISKQAKVGEYIFSAEDSYFLSQCVIAFERLELEENKAATLFEFIDISKQVDVVYIGIRNSDLVIRIYGQANFLQKLNKAYSVYPLIEINEPTHKNITVAGDLSWTSSKDVVYQP